MSTIFVPLFLELVLDVVVPEPTSMGLAEGEEVRLCVEAEEAEEASEGDAAPE